MKNGFIVYEKPDCVRCKITKQYIEGMGIDYEVRQIFNEDGSRTEEAQALISGFGFQVAPLVAVIKDGKEVEYWSNLRTDKLSEYRGLL